MVLSSLVTQLCAKEMLQPAAAYALAWRIQNEYPADLRQAAELWAEDKPVPNVEVTEISLEQIQRQTGISVLGALDILYVLSKSPTDGRTILTRCARRDQRY